MAVKSVNRIMDNGDVAAIAAAAPVKVIELKTRMLQMRIRGMSPLIQHRFGAKAIQAMENKQTGKGREGRQPKVPEECFKEAMILDDEGKHCIPANAIKGAMVSATTSIADKTFPKTKIRQAVFVIGDLIPLINHSPAKMRTDVVRLGNGKNKVADIRYRPMFEKWEADITVQFNEMAITVDQVVNLLNLAGFAVGIGEWRPEKDGTFGRFEIVRRVELKGESNHG